MLDLAFPMFEALKKYVIKSPSFSFYIVQALKNWTWVTILLRLVDAVTDISLTKTYFQDFDSVVKDFLSNTRTLQSAQSSCDLACFTEQCRNDDDWNRRLVCTFPLMEWWISGTLSVIVLAVTYLAEAISTIMSKKFDHYFQMYSGGCCKKHHKVKFIALGLILPLSQQVTTLIYGHWIKSFVGYWQDKNAEMIESLPSNTSGCTKHCEDNEWKDKACVTCCYNVKELEKLDDLITNADEVENHGQKLFASTENLLMPMVQFAFLFPMVLFAFTTSKTFSKTDGATPLDHVSDNWTGILIISSIVSSLLSLVGSQTKIYFTSPGKMNQKSFKNSAMIFTIIMLQVLPKIMAFQTFSFGLVGSELKCPDGILILLLVFPYFSATWKTLLVALCLFIYHKLTFEKVKQLFLSPFIFTQIEKDDLGDDDNGGKLCLVLL